MNSVHSADAAVGHQKELAPLLSPIHGSLSVNSASINGPGGYHTAELGAKEDDTSEVSRNQLGTINGVYIPCLLNILGAVLFMRVGYVVGYAGYLGAIALFGFSNLVAVLTAISFSAIVTNGKMGGGGVYYMISRSMGPAFGGATGLLFYLCYVINSAFNATAMVQDLISTFFKNAPSIYFTYFYHGTLFFLLMVALAGADAFARLNMLLFIALIVSALVALFSLVFGHSHVVDTLPANGTSSCHHQDPAHFPMRETEVNFYAPNSHTFHDNLFADFTDKNNQVVVLALVYTTTCGIMVGANLSGDLKDPGKSLPRGTLLAMLTSFSTYMLYATVLAACFPREILQCEFLVLQKAAISPYVVVAGVAMATLSTSLGAMFGASRILQAIARDNIVPLSYFGKGTKKGDEPLRAVCITWALVNAFGYIGGGSMESIAQILTDFFLTACAFVNLSQMLLSLSNAPNYRPSFQYATWWSSGLGFVLAISLMWYLNWFHALCTCIAWIVIFVYITVTCEEKPWGNVHQAILYRAIVYKLRDLVVGRTHAKFWRSSVLLLAQDADYPLLQLCKKLTYEGLFMVGTSHIDDDGITLRPVIDQESIVSEAPAIVEPAFLASKMLPHQTSDAAVIKASWLWLLDQLNLGAFVQVGIGKTRLEVFRTLISCAGLGALVPNTVALPYQEFKSRPPPDFILRVNRQLSINCKVDKAGIHRCCKRGKTCAVCNFRPAHNSTLGEMTALEYTQLLLSILEQEMNILVVRNSGELDGMFGSINTWAAARQVSFVDVWILGTWDWATLEERVALLLQHAHLAQQAFVGRCKLRIIQFAHCMFPEELTVLRNNLKDLAEATRINMPELLVVEASSSPPLGPMPMDMDSALPTLEYNRALNDAMRSHSQDTTLAFVSLPALPENLTAASADVYMGCLNILTSGLPPMVLIAKGERGSVISTHI
eukprot:m.591542 g.591542  ORF g.591542 m.591542 type:complete len:945 (+) comp22380_c0_seq1:148-2982(+)